MKILHIHPPECIDIVAHQDEVFVSSDKDEEYLDSIEYEGEEWFSVAFDLYGVRSTNAQDFTVSLDAMMHDTARFFGTVQPAFIPRYDWIHDRIPLLQNLEKLGRHTWCDIYLMDPTKHEVKNCPEWVHACVIDSREVTRSTAIRRIKAYDRLRR